jgi:hypothetical protein
MPYLVKEQLVTDDRIRAEEARISRHPKWQDIAGSKMYNLVR